ncbi:MAG: PaaI family thioesterase [Acidobacteria bacterium]|nr:PaaI family thioesterase [Acidobacteriota bacterium]
MTKSSELSRHPMKKASKINRSNARNHCFGCGPHNTGGMHLKFTVEGTDPVVRGALRMPGRYQGSRKILHGGIVALLMDEAMGKFNRVEEIVAPTAELSVEYLRPVPVGRKIHVEARRIRQQGRHYWRECTILDEDGKLLARGKGRFVKIGDRVPPSGNNGVRK